MHSVPGNPEPVISVRNLDYWFEKNGRSEKVLDSVTFELYRGLTTVLVGESGSGKSLLSLSLARILKHSARLSADEMIFRDDVSATCFDITRLSEKKLNLLRGSKISYIFQEPFLALNPVFTIRKQIELVLVRAGKDTDSVEDYLREVEISDAARVAELYPAQLSGGMQQRVLIAMAIASGSLVLIADEPTTALDATVQREIIKLLKRLVKQKGIALLMVTHDISLAPEIADEVMVLYAGQVLEKGPVEQVLGKPCHPYTRRLVQSMVPETKELPLQPIGGSVPEPGNRPAGRCIFIERCDEVEDRCNRAMAIEACGPNGHTCRCIRYQT